MLGYGLVEIPRGLWNNANVEKSLHLLEKKASKVKENVVDSEAEMYEVARV
jgi:hypothetical protein